MNTKGSRKEPMPEITEAMIFKWASQGLTRGMMARRLNLNDTTLNRIVQRSKELQIAELKGKIKFLE